MESAVEAVAQRRIPPYVDGLQHISRYAEVDEVMSSPDFVQGGGADRREFLGDCLLMLDGDHHLEKKQRYSALFTKGAMTFYETQLLDPVIEQVMSELQTHKGKDGLARTDLVPLIRIMLHRIAARVVGVDDVNTPERTERFRILVTRMGEAQAARFTKGEIGDVVKAGRQTLATLIDEFLRAPLERRQALVRRCQAGELPKEELPKDLLTLICLHGDDVRPGDEAHYAYVFRECSFFLAASTQTTSHELPHVVVHLCHWLGEHPEDAPKLRDPAFLRLAAGESLRLHQTAPVKLRIATRDVTLASSGRQVAAGEQVALLAPFANLDTDVFGPDALAFNPYRTPPKGVQPWGLTFGAGVHSCLGRSLVTGLMNRADAKSGTEGTMVKILKVLFHHGVELDPDDPPKFMARSYHDAYESVPIILRGI